jgi:hypothetical protein
MKRFFALFLVLIILSLGACTKKVNIVKLKTPPPGQVKKSSAPGQVKKTTGSQSAAPYAPGQQKKGGSTGNKKK